MQKMELEAVAPIEITTSASSSLPKSIAKFET